MGEQIQIYKNGPLSSNILDTIKWVNIGKPYRNTESAKVFIQAGTHVAVLKLQKWSFVTLTNSLTRNHPQTPFLSLPTRNTGGDLPLRFRDRRQRK